jgi:hypothetical protein
MNMGLLKTPPTIDDSITAGIADAFPECKAIPEVGENGRTRYRMTGDFHGVLQRIYQNEPIGALDVLRAVKNARQAIFNFRTKQENDTGDEGNGKNFNR